MTDPASNVPTSADDEARHPGVSISYIDTAPDSDRISTLGVNSSVVTTGTTRPHRGAWVATPAKMPEEPENDSATAITGRDVANIFRHSVTTGTVTQEEIDRVKQMHDRISEGVDFNFNYYSLLIAASIIAGLGLVSNNSTTVISSMLLSPIMGPVIGMSYGTVIWDWKLVRRSIRNELISLLACVVFGALIGLACGWTDLAQEWATDEMLSRGTWQNFLVALPVAFFSGIGVALSVLDDQTSSLVGVAISASLLPPAVNAGLLWVFAGMTNVDALGQKASGDDFFQMGGISLLLTVANIILVWLAGALMFRIKEVLPIKKKVFWDDLKTARRIYQHRALLAKENNGNIEIPIAGQGVSMSRTRTSSE